MEKICILAIESSTPTLGVGLIVVDSSGHELYYQRLHEGSSQHAEHVLPLLDELLAEAGIERNRLSAVAFGQGPGGFTGLRVASGVAQGIAFGLGIPVLPVSSLLAVAHVHRSEPFDIHAVILDARMQELYAGAFTFVGSRWELVHPATLIDAHHLQSWLQELQDVRDSSSVQVLGSGLEVCSELGLSLTPFSVGPQSIPHVQHIAELGLCAFQRGEGLDPELAAPLYIRDKVAFTISERAAGQGGNPSAKWEPIGLEPMTEQHLPAIMAVDRLINQKPWSINQWHASLNAGHQGWVLRRGDTLYAFLLSAFIGTESELLLMGTNPDYQQRGYATWLLDRWQSHALQKQVQQLQLEVRASNRQAQRVYERFGFRRVGVRPGYYPENKGVREDAWLYSKHLTS